MTEYPVKNLMTNISSICLSYSEFFLFLNLLIFSNIFLNYYFPGEVIPEISWFKLNINLKVILLFVSSFGCYFLIIIPFIISMIDFLIDLIPWRYLEPFVVMDISSHNDKYSHAQNDVLKMAIEENNLVLYEIYKDHQRKKTNIYTNKMLQYGFSLLLLVLLDCSLGKYSITMMAYRFTQEGTLFLRCLFSILFLLFCLMSFFVIKLSFFTFNNNYYIDLPITRELTKMERASPEFYNGMTGNNINFNGPKSS